MKLPKIGRLTVCASLLLSLATLALPQSSASAASSCAGLDGSNDPSQTGHAYSGAFTTCGSADGISAHWNVGDGGWQTDGRAGSHVNVTIGINYDDLNSLEVGYWRQPGSSLDQFFYVGRFSDGNYGSRRLRSGGPAPTGGGADLQILRSQTAGSKTYDVSVDGTIFASYAEPTASSSLLQAFSEEATNAFASSSVSSQLTPINGFSGLSYHAGSSWYAWGSHSRCFVNYSAGETFAARPFATAFNSQIGGSAGNYSGCSGSAPTTSRTNW